jgi:hypothetical protein
MSILKTYLERYSEIQGFFSQKAMFDWDFFLTQQDNCGVSGHFLEIGVYQGKSAVLGALHLKANEMCILNDIHSMETAAAAIETFRPTNNIYIEGRSAELAVDHKIAPYKGQFRWIHIDGDHTGHATFQDLRLAGASLNEHGIICIDDFFNFRYPQLTAAVYRFLFDEVFGFTMLFCGANKCYLCRPSAYALYESLIRRYYLVVAGGEGLSEDLQLNKSSYARDFGCFSSSPKTTELGLWGLDSAPEEIVF